jgi:hypothetical protein
MKFTDTDSKFFDTLYIQWGLHDHVKTNVRNYVEHHMPWHKINQIKSIKNKIPWERRK